MEQKVRINNTTYKEANEEIASYVRRWPDKFIGFAKHDSKTEAGKIRNMLHHEVIKLGLRGLKLHGIPTKEMVETAAEFKIHILLHPPNVGDSLEVIESHPEFPAYQATLLTNSETVSCSE